MRDGLFERFICDNCQLLAAVKIDRLSIVRGESASTPAGWVWLKMANASNKEDRLYCSHRCVIEALS